MIEADVGSIITEGGGDCKRRSLVVCGPPNLRRTEKTMMSEICHHLNQPVYRSLAGFGGD